jgi:hypothetical protein
LSREGEGEREREVRKQSETAAADDDGDAPIEIAKKTKTVLSLSPSTHAVDTYIPPSFCAPAKAPDPPEHAAARMREPAVCSRIGGERRAAAASSSLDGDELEAATSKRRAGSPDAGHSARYLPHGELQRRGGSSPAAAAGCR